MGKKKNSGRGLAAKLEMKKKKSRPDNPFERRFALEKHKVLNRKSKTDDLALGRPGQSRSRAIQKRKATLLQEYKVQNKSNVFIDNRIGERDKTMSQEERMVSRYALAEKSSRSKKHSLFQLGDEEDNEILTHSGKALSEIERFEDPRSDDDDQLSKDLDAKFVEETHFGGFMTRADMEFSQGKSNPRKEWIENIIAESKKRKLEKQKDLEETEEMTKNLDDKWKTLMPALKETGQIYTKRNKQDTEDKEEEKATTDSFETLVFELGLDRRKEAKDKLKTEEDIIREEKERLEKLEADRIRRMNGEDCVEDMEPEQEVQGDGETEDNDSDEEEDDDDDEDDDDYDNNSDLHSDDSDQESELKTKFKKKKKGPEKPLPEVSKIPFTFPIPNSYEEFASFFTNRTPGEHAIVLERLIKCNHPQFGNNNRESLQNVFAFLLQYFNDAAMDIDDQVDMKEKSDIFDKLFPFAYDLVQFSPQASAEALRAVLIEKYEQFNRNSKSHPSFETVIFLKLICILFPTSDYRHPVTTPSMQFISHALSSCKFNSRPSIATGLFLASLGVEALQISKRYFPEIVSFLVGIVYVSCPKGVKVVPYLPPFKVVGPESELLADKLDNRIQPDKLKYWDMKLQDDVDSVFATNALFSSLKLIEVLLNLWQEKEFARDAMMFLEKFLPLLPNEKLHPQILEVKSSVATKLENLMSKQKAISTQRVKPKVLKLYDPEIDNNFDPFTKQHKGSKEKQEMNKLLHKMKREKKGAKKDIRADMAFLATQKAKEARKRDMERMKKTKEILAGLGNQEGDVRKLQRKRKRMK